ncbi:MAG: hypothetical protein LPK11_07080 [Chromatiaceae bacterium]|nr:hypothetical protein [Chromatiaceae bacterium]
MHQVLFKHTQMNHEAFPIAEIGASDGTCRFCGSENAKFDSAAHSVPEFLGNKSIFTLDECDACNSYFGQKIERDLSKFTPPSWFTRLKGKKKYSRSMSIGGVTLYGEQSFVNIEFSDHCSVSRQTFETRGRRFSNANVYKAWLKILISLIPKSYLCDFRQIIKWLRSGDDQFVNLKHQPFLIIGHQLPDYRLPDILDIEVIRQLSAGHPVYQLNARFNNYYVKFPFSPKLNCKFRVGEILPARSNVDEVYFQVIDLSNYVCQHNYKLKLEGLSI